MQRKRNQWLDSKFVISRSITHEYIFAHVFCLQFFWLVYFYFVLYALENTESYMISVGEFNWTRIWKSDFDEVEDDSAG